MMTRAPANWNKFEKLLLFSNFDYYSVWRYYNIYTHGNQHIIVLFDGSITAEESDKENYRSGHDEDDRWSQNSSLQKMTELTDIR